MPCYNNSACYGAVTHYHNFKKKPYQDTKYIYIFYRIGLRRISIGGGAVWSLVAVTTRRDGPGFESQDDDEAWGLVCLFGRLLLCTCGRGSGWGAVISTRCPSPVGLTCGVFLTSKRHEHKLKLSNITAKKKTHKTHPEWFSYRLHDESLAWEQYNV